MTNNNLITSSKGLTKSKSFTSFYETDLFSREKFEGKKAVASNFLISFICEVLSIQETDFTNKVSNTIIELDNLAIKIDSILDNDILPNTLTIQQIKENENLELKVTECFSYLKDYPNLNSLIKETLSYVDISFKYNTSLRYKVYSLDKYELTNNTCTTLYLLPIINYMSETIAPNSKSSISNIFILASNYIQLVDDFLDLFEDINSNCITPISVKFSSLRENLDMSDAYVQLKDIVAEKMHEYIKKINEEILIDNEFHNILNDLDKFNKDFLKIKFHKKLSRVEIDLFLKNLRKSVPPIVSYAA